MDHQLRVLEVLKHLICTFILIYPLFRFFRGEKNDEEGTNVARIICDIHNADGTPFEGCPRCNLKRVIKEAADLGYVLNVGPEAEFFLFNMDEKGNPTLETHDKAGYYDVGPDDRGENVRAQMVETLKKMGFDIEASHHEVADGQHEIDFKYADALTTADNVVSFKYAVKAVAAKNNLYATFMPKPLDRINGSGMHLNMSLFNEKAMFSLMKMLKSNFLKKRAISWVLDQACA